MFLNRFLSSIIFKVIHQYIDNPAECVNVSLSRQCITLTNVRIKPVVLQHHLLNVNVEGHISLVEVKIPWNFIYTWRLHVRVDNPCVVAAAEIAVQNVTDYEEPSCSQLHADSPSPPHEGESGYSRKAMNSLLQNIQIEVNNLQASLRGVDSSENAYDADRFGVVFACGIVRCGPSLSVPETAGERHTRTSLVNKLMKSIDIGSLALYLTDPHSTRVDIMKLVSLRAHLEYEVDQKCVMIECDGANHMQIFLSASAVDIIHRISDSMWLAYINPVTPPLRPQRGDKELNRKWWKWFVGTLKKSASWEDNQVSVQRRCFQYYLWKHNAPWREECWKSRNVLAPLQLHQMCSRQAFAAVSQYYATGVTVSVALHNPAGDVRHQTDTGMHWSATMGWSNVDVRIEEESLICISGLQVKAGAVQDPTSVSPSRQSVEVSAYMIESSFSEEMLKCDDSSSHLSKAACLRCTIAETAAGADVSITGEALKWSFSMSVLHKVVKVAQRISIFFQTDKLWNMLQRRRRAREGPPTMVNGKLCIDSIAIALENAITVNLRQIRTADERALLPTVEEASLEVEGCTLVFAKGVRCRHGDAEAPLALTATKIVVSDGVLTEIERLKDVAGALKDAQLTPDVRDDAPNQMMSLRAYVDEVVFETISLQQVVVQVEAQRGWELVICARGISTHSSTCTDGLLKIVLRADAFLSRMTCASEMDEDGIGFLIYCSDLVIVLDSELVSYFERLYDAVMLILFPSDDSHVYLTDPDNQQSHIYGTIDLCKTKLILDEFNSNAEVVLPAVVIDALERDGEAVRISVKRTREKSMEVRVCLHDSVSARLRDVEVRPFELFPYRKGGCITLCIHLSPPTPSHIAIFPFTRLRIDVEIHNRAVAAHVPTAMALWRHFDTPESPLGRLKSLPSRVHFSSRRSRNRSPPPRSPTSSVHFELGRTSLKRHAPGVLEGGGSDLYSFPVFPYDTALYVTATGSEVYYPVRDGDDAHGAVPMYLFTPAHRFMLSLHSRAGLTELQIRAVGNIPRVRCSTLPTPLDDPLCSPPAQTASPAERIVETLFSIQLHFTYDSRPRVLWPGRSSCGVAAERMHISIGAAQRETLALSSNSLHAYLGPEEAAAYVTLLTAKRHLGPGWRSPGYQPARSDPRQFRFHLRVVPFVIHVPCLALAAVAWGGVQSTFDTMSVESFLLALPRFSCIIHESLVEALPDDHMSPLARLQRLEDAGFGFLQLLGGGKRDTEDGVPALSSVTSASPDTESETVWHMRRAAFALNANILRAIRVSGIFHYFQCLHRLIGEQVKAVETLAADGMSAYVTHLASRAPSPFPVKCEGEVRSRSVFFLDDLEIRTDLPHRMHGIEGQHSVVLRLQYLFYGRRPRTVQCDNEDAPSTSMEDSSMSEIASPAGPPLEETTVPSIPLENTKVANSFALPSSEGVFTLCCGETFLLINPARTDSSEGDGAYRLIPVIHPFSIFPQGMCRSDHNKSDLGTHFHGEGEAFTVSTVTTLRLTLSSSSYMFLFDTYHQVQQVLRGSRYAAGVDPDVLSNTEGQWLKTHLDKLMQHSCVNQTVRAHNPPEQNSQLDHSMGMLVSNVIISLSHYERGEEEEEEWYWQKLYDDRLCTKSKLRGDGEGEGGNGNIRRHPTATPLSTVDENGGHSEMYRDRRVGGWCAGRGKVKIDTNRLRKALELVVSSVMYLQHRDASAKTAWRLQVHQAVCRLRTTRLVCDIRGVNLHSGCNAQRLSRNERKASADPSASSDTSNAMESEEVSAPSMADFPLCSVPQGCDEVALTDGVVESCSATVTATALATIVELLLEGPASCSEVDAGRSAASDNELAAQGDAEAEKLLRIADNVWHLRGDMFLSRRHPQGSRMVFSNAHTNHIVVHLHGHRLRIDGSGLTSGRTRRDKVVIIVEENLTVTFVGGAIQLPAQSLQEMKERGMLEPQDASCGSAVLEQLLFPYVVLGNGSFVECVGVRGVMEGGDVSRPAPTPTSVRSLPYSSADAVVVAASHQAIQTTSLVVKALTLRLSPSADISHPYFQVHNPRAAASPAAKPPTLVLSGGCRGEWHRIRKEDGQCAQYLLCRADTVSLFTHGRSVHGWSTADTSVFCDWSPRIRVGILPGAQKGPSSSQCVSYAVDVGQWSGELTFQDIALVTALRREWTELWKTKKYVGCRAVERKFNRLLDEVMRGDKVTAAPSYPDYHSEETAASGPGGAKTLPPPPPTSVRSSLTVVSSTVLLRLCSYRSPLIEVGVGAVVVKSVDSVSHRQEDVELSGVHASVFGKGGWDNVLSPSATLHLRHVVTRQHTNHTTVCRVENVQLHSSLHTMFKAHAVHKEIQQLNRLLAPPPPELGKRFELCLDQENDAMTAEDEATPRKKRGTSPEPLAPGEVLAGVEVWSEGLMDVVSPCSPSTNQPSSTQTGEGALNSTTHCFTNALDCPYFLVLFPLGMGGVDTASHKEAKQDVLPSDLSSIADYEIVEVPPMSSAHLSIPYKRGMRLYLCVLSRRCVVSRSLSSHHENESQHASRSLRAGSSHGVQRLSPAGLAASPSLTGVWLDELQFGVAKGLVLEEGVLVLSCTEDFCDITRRARTDVVHAPSQWAPSEGMHAGSPSLPFTSTFPGGAAFSPDSPFFGAPAARNYQHSDIIHIRIHAKITLRNETGLTLDVGLAEDEAQRKAQGSSDGLVGVATGEYCPVYDSCESLRLQAVVQTRVYEATLHLTSVSHSSFLTLHPRSLSDTEKLHRHHQQRVNTAGESQGNIGYISRDNSQDMRPLVFYVMIAVVANHTSTDVILLPRLTVVNAVGAPLAITVWQKDSLAGPQTSTDREMMNIWQRKKSSQSVATRPHHTTETSDRLVLLGAHHSLPHKGGLFITQCTYASNLVLGISFTQPTGEVIGTCGAPSGLVEVCSVIRDAAKNAGAPPICITVQQENGQPFHLLVTVRSRTVILSAAMWVCNMTNYPVLLTNHWVTRKLVPGVCEMSGVAPCSGSPTILGVLLHRFDHAFMKIGLDGEWSDAFSTGIGASGVIESRCGTLNVTRSCNYTVYFPNATVHQPAVFLVTPRWVFFNSTGKRLRIHLQYPGLKDALEYQAVPESGKAHPMHCLIDRNANKKSVEDRNKTERERTAAVAAVSEIYLKPNDFYVSCVGTREGNRISLQEDLTGIVPSLEALDDQGMTRAGATVTSCYEAERTDEFSVDNPGEAFFNLWAVPTPRHPQLATWDGVVVTAYPQHDVAQRHTKRPDATSTRETQTTDAECVMEAGAETPLPPPSSSLTLFDSHASLDAAVTGRLAVSVAHARDNVLVVSISAVESTKICLQNRTLDQTIMARQNGCGRRSVVPCGENRYFSWEEASGSRVLLLHSLGCKGERYAVDLEGGDCVVHYQVLSKIYRATSSGSQAAHWSDDTPPTKRKFSVEALVNRKERSVTLVVTSSPSLLLMRPVQQQHQSTMIVLQLSHLTWNYSLQQGRDIAPFLDAGGDASAFSPSNSSTAEAGSPPSVTAVLHGVDIEFLDADDTQSGSVAVQAAQLLAPQTGDGGGDSSPILYRAVVREQSASVFHSILSRYSGAFAAPSWLAVRYSFVKNPDGMKRLTEGRVRIAPLVLDVTDWHLAHWIKEVQAVQYHISAMRLREWQSSRPASEKQQRRRRPALEMDSLHSEQYLLDLMASVGRPTDVDVESTGIPHSMTAVGAQGDSESLMHIDQFLVDHVSVFLSFSRHDSDPLRPLLGVYTLMLPSRLDHTEIQLQPFTCRRQTETFASLRGRLREWGRNGLREQWTKLTRLGTLLETLRRSAQPSLMPRPAPLKAELREIEWCRDGVNK